MAETEEQRIATFQRLADQRLDRSYRLANAILGDESQSQDAVHDAFVTAWQKWGSLRDRAKFDVWFDRIVVNICRNRLDAGRYRQVADLSGPQPSYADMAADVHRKVLVEQALARLKPDDVVVLTLRHFLDLQLADVALLLDVPLQTVNTRLRTARSRLRQVLDEMSSDEVSG